MELIFSLQTRDRNEPHVSKKPILLVFIEERGGLGPGASLMSLVLFRCIWYLFLFPQWYQH